MAFKREGDKVVITITEDEYGSLMFLLGYALGGYSKEGLGLESPLKLVNSINEGNPDYRPYVTNEPAATKQ